MLQGLFSEKGKIDDMEEISKKHFYSLIRQRKLEDIKKIKIFEKILKNERGYVFKMPKRGSDVILLVSGGLDSITVWGILMKEYGLNVYPIIIDIGQRRFKREHAAFKYFDRFYKKKFPKNYRRYVNFDIKQNNNSIKVENTLKDLKEEVILESFKKGRMSFNGSFSVSIIFPLLARSYGMYLNATQAKRINTIFSAVVANDGEFALHQTLTALRSIMCNMCVATGDYSWQFVSICLEPELGLFMKKADLVKWGVKNKLPLEKTWSCYYSKKYQCGVNCTTCGARKHAFLEAGVKDKTIYKSIEDQQLISKLFQKAKKKATRFLTSRLKWKKLS